MDKSLYKGIPHQSSLLDFDKYIVHSSTHKSQLFSLIRDCQIDSLKIRCDVWRLCLGIVSIDATFEEKAQQLQNERNRYEQLLNKHVRKGQVEPVDSGNANGNGNGKESVMIGKNPLGKLLVATKPAVVITKEQQDDKFLQEEVRKDVERTYQQRQFFKNIEIIKILSRVLFVWSRQFPDISYKQGMNQVGASMIWVYFQSCIDPNTSHKDLEGITQQLQQKYLFFHSNQHAQADIYSLFDRMMNSNHKQMFRSETENNKQINPNSKNNSPILQRIIKLSDIKFKIIDGELFRHIKLNEVAMRPFLLKWIRCIHTREFELEESFALWDNIFLAYHLEPQGGMYFIDCTTLAMLVYLRDIALKKDARFEIVQLYQKYPKIKGKQLQEVVNLAWTVKGCLENGGAGKEAEKKKELEFRQDVIGEFKVYGEEEYKSEKAMMEEKQKRERQERAQANNLTKQASVEQQKVEKKEVLSPMMEKSSSFMSEKAIIPKTQNNEPQQSLPSQQPKPSQQPPIVKQEHKSPKPNPNPILIIQQRKNSQKASQPPSQKKTPVPPKPSQQKPISKQSPPPPPPAPPASKPLNYTITFNHTEWKQIQELMKKSIEENTDLESRSLTMKVMKIFASKGQQETKRLQSIEEQQ